MVFQNQQLNPIQIAISIVEFTSELNCSNHFANATVTVRFDVEFWCPTSTRCDETEFECGWRMLLRNQNLNLETVEES